MEHQKEELYNQGVHKPACRNAGNMKRIARTTPDEDIIS